MGEWVLGVFFDPSCKQKKMSNDIKLKKKLILGDLGKATRRGIRR